MPCDRIAGFVLRACLEHMAGSSRSGPRRFGGAAVPGDSSDTSAAGVAALIPGGPLWLVIVIDGEFDPGSGRTLAACLTHASRTVKPFGVDQWRTGE